jgi:hypothetical protein
MTRHVARVFCIAAVNIAIAGCTDVSDTDMAKIGALVFHQIANIGTSESVPRSRAAAIPYATLGVRLGSSDESMFVLARKTGNDLHWLGGKPLAITTRAGRIVQTAGFEHNLTGFQGRATASSLSTVTGTEEYTYDFADRSR